MNVKRARYRESSLFRDFQCEWILQYDFGLRVLRYETGVTASPLRVLVSAWSLSPKSGYFSVISISKFLRISRQKVSRSVSILVEKGYVEKMAGNGRTMMRGCLGSSFRLTKSGVDLINRFSAIMNQLASGNHVTINLDKI